MPDKKRVTQSDLLEAIHAALEQAKEDRFTIANLTNAQAEQMQAIVGVLAAMATDIGRMAQHLAPVAPNYRAQLGDYAGFNWSEIGAEVVTKDGHGISAVHWAGYLWKRRSGGGRFGKGIWFSRPNGKDAEGNVQYLRLITFKDLDEPEPLAFDAPDTSTPLSTGPGRHPDQAAAQHLIYEDGAHVPDHPGTVAAFNAFTYAHRRKPKSSDELKAWHEQQQEEEADATA